jgi:hypothetical protein
MIWGLCYDRGKISGEDEAMNLNIRQKVGLVFAASIVVIALIAGYSYYYLKAIELKQHVVEVANDLQEMILEIRRYEKKLPALRFTGGFAAQCAPD